MGNLAETGSTRTAVLVDEHPLWLQAVAQVLERIAIDVVGTTTSLAEATSLIEELRPGVVVAEISPGGPDDGGLVWLAEIHRRFPDIKLVVLSMSDNVSHINGALSNGAAAFVVKRANPDELAVAIQQTYEHSIYLPAWAPLYAEPPELTEHPDLTRRELEILRLVAEGHSNAELAKMLWVTEQTVKFHLSNVYRKLNVSNRTEASRWAQLNGLLSVHPVASRDA
jgi:DNA-binding NarL/FixJ family response regulator